LEGDKMFEELHLVHEKFNDSMNALQKSASHKSVFDKSSFNKQDVNAASVIDVVLDADYYYLPGREVQPEITKIFPFIQSFGVLECYQNYFTRRHGMDSYLLLFSYEGQGELQYEGEIYTLKPGDIAFIDCQKPHFYQTVKDHWTHADLHLNGVQLALFYQLFSEGRAVVFRPSPKLQAHVLLSELLLTHTKADKMRDVKVANQLQNLLTKLIEDTAGKQPTPIEAIIFRLQERLEQHFTENFTLDELANFCNTSKFYLSREFKKIVGVAPIDYLINLKINHAKYLLLNTDLPAYKIANQVGINDFNRFNKLFKKRVGETPKQFRSFL
jgi:AraC-like DNA-binding protein